MSDPSPAAEPPPPAESRPTSIERAVAVLEILICSDYPTQIALGTTLAAFGYRPAAGGRISLAFVTALSGLDTIVLLALIFLFIRAHDERPRDIFLGSRPIGREVLIGFPLTILALAIAVAAQLVVQGLAPSLHTVEHNPFQDLLRSPGQAVVFALVVVIAGGVREELQRAFLLQRFSRWLGGGAVGVVVTSLAFGLGHIQVQGTDAGIVTGLLGACWGIVYIRRRSAVAPIVSHSGFNLIEIAQFLSVGR